MSDDVHVRPLTGEDVDWAVRVLAARRAALLPHAPLLWRPAADADERHAAHLRDLLGAGGARGVRTDEGLLLAAPARDGWVVDDAWVPDDRWDHEGAALWSGLTAALDDRPATVVCPTPERARLRFFLAAGFEPSRSWWHRRPRAASPGADPGAGAGEVRSVPAPPVYDPGGPVTFVSAVRDLAVLDHAEARARTDGSPLVVVDQPVGDTALAEALADRGFVRHCDFLRTPASVGP